MADHLRGLSAAADWTGGAPLGGRGEVTVRWLGTAGFAVEHAGHILLLDPYLTRASLATCAFGRVRPDAELVRRHAPRADAIVLGHTHFDHALDAPLIARATGARVLGSSSAIALCRAAGVPDAQLELAPPPPRTVEVGPFALRFWPSAHSRFLAGRVPFPGDIDDCDAVPLRIGGYRCGAVFGVEIEVAGRRIYHVGSAELVDAGLAVRPVDLVLACVAGWTSSDRYPERLARAFAPGGVLLHHWDNFLRPLDRPARAFPAMRTAALVDRLRAAAPGVAVGAVDLLGQIAL